MKKKYIYESPDGGKTIYRREFMAPHNTRELIKKPKQTLPRYWFENN
tara:strand:+ start:765 stop:905 length:141 start_codon:yes stop_codon:yes gene_type:complete